MTSSGAEQVAASQEDERRAAPDLTKVTSAGGRRCHCPDRLRSGRLAAGVAYTDIVTQPELHSAYPVAPAYPERTMARRSFDRFASAVAGCPTLRGSAELSPDLRVPAQPDADTSDTSLDVVLTGSSGPPYSLELAVSQYKKVVTWALVDLSEGIPAGRAPAALRTFNTGLATADHIGG